MSTSYHMTNGNLSVHLPLRLGGGTGFWKFGILWGGQKMLFFSRDCPNRGHIYFLGGSPIHSPFLYLNTRFKNVFFVVFSLFFTYFCFELGACCLSVSLFVCPSRLLRGGLTEHSKLKSQKPWKLGGGQKIFVFKGDCSLVGI